MASDTNGGIVQANPAQRQELVPRHKRGVALGASMLLFIGFLTTFYMVKQDTLAGVFLALSFVAGVVSVGLSHSIAPWGTLSINVLTVIAAAYVSLIPAKTWEFKSSIYHLEYRSGDTFRTANILIERHPTHGIITPTTPSSSMSSTDGKTVAYFPSSTQTTHVDDTPLPSLSHTSDYLFTHPSHHSDPTVTVRAEEFIEFLEKLGLAPDHEKAKALLAKLNHDDLLKEFPSITRLTIVCQQSELRKHSPDTGERFEEKRRSLIVGGA